MYTTAILIVLVALQGVNGKYLSMNCKCNCDRRECCTLFGYIIIIYAMPSLIWSGVISKIFLKSKIQARFFFIHITLLAPI